MKTPRLVLGVTAAILLMTAVSFAQGEKDGQGQIVVTILPKHDGGEAPAVSVQDAKLKVNGKETAITRLTALSGSRDNLELVVLIDNSSRSSLGNQLSDIEKFILRLPPNARVGVAYMQFGQAVMAAPPSTDHAQAVRGLHLPSGSAGSNGSPYFCLSDLAKHWPEADGAARRVVLMVTDGVDEYNPRYDPDNPYVQAALADSVKAGLVVYSIYWRGRGPADNTAYQNNAGQNLLVQVTDATGGKSFWQGMGNPVSFEPFLDELTRRLRNQYELSFATAFNGKPTVEGVKLKLSVPGAEVNSPQQVFITRPGLAENQ
jgi:hypothetical protein